jgi:hypothetical protein
MATVNKDFKIKSGLIVEGTTGTINGYNILTESQDSQDFIIDIIGGETLITSVESTQLEVISGELNVKANVFDAYGAAATAQGNAEDYADGLASNYDPAGSATTAENNAKSYADGLAVNYDAAGAATTAENNAKSYADGLASNYDPAGSASTAQSNAEDYADAKISDANGTATDKAWSAYKTSTEIGLAQAAAELHADNAIAALVDSAPATLDTLNELAQALQDNPDIISDLQDIAAGKQDTLTAGANIDITGATISVTGLDSADISDFNTAALSATSAAYDVAGAAATAQSNAEDYADGLAVNYDAAGAAATAEQNAKDYADALDTDDVAEGLTNQYFTDSRAKTSAADLLTGASLTNITITGTGAGLTITAENGVADSTTSDLAEGSNLYFTNARAQDALEGTTPTFAAVNIDEVAKHVAGTTVVPVAGIATAYSWLKADYRSAEFLVKVAYGTHTEISKVLLTLDTSDNISVTEYGIVGTNGSGSSSVSAAISGNDVQLKVTTLNNTSTVTVVGTLLA